MVSFVRENMLDAFKDVQIQSFKYNVGSSNNNTSITTTNTTTTNTTTTNTSSDSESVSLLDELIERFARSFSKDAKADDNKEQEAKNILNLVDKDQDGTISIGELQTFDTSTVSSETKNQIKDLESKFKIYDKDGSGELSLAEIKKAICAKQYSLQELGAMANEDKTENKDENQNQVVFDGLSYPFFHQALNNYEKANSDFVK